MASALGNRGLTIRKRIFLTNSIMVLLSLMLLLAIGGGMLAISKDQFLGWYSANSQITAGYTQAYEMLAGRKNHFLMFFTDPLTAPAAIYGSGLADPA